ncbi:MAG TPA: hypothetical protein VF782_11065 [Allosphingosinicella sp.]
MKRSKSTSYRAAAGAILVWLTGSMATLTPAYAAQGAPRINQASPRLLLIVEERSAPGAHARHLELARKCAVDPSAPHAPRRLLAAVSLSGRERIWFVYGYSDLEPLLAASVETNGCKYGGNGSEFIESRTSTILRFRPGLSRGTRLMPDGTRYFTARTLMIPTNRLATLESSFASTIAADKTDSAGVISYEVIAGGSPHAVIQLTPLSTAAEAERAAGMNRSQAPSPLAEAADASLDEYFAVIPPR